MRSLGVVPFVPPGCAVAPWPKVVRVEPSAQVIPATTLRFYVTFDRPARGRVHQDEVKLLTAEGAPLPSPFMDFGQELWSPDGRRLTVLIDPGRVKRDVEAPGSEVAPLRQGGRYQVAIGDYRQSFLVGPAIRQPLDAGKWRVAVPGQSGDGVAVEFDRVMDAALLADQLMVVTPDGRLVDGEIRIDGGGLIWRFIPRTAWAAGSYRILLGPVLEDVSGNRIDEALDHDVGSPAAPSRSITLPFTVPSMLQVSP